MAPEQGMGQEIDHRADLCAVGVLFYRLLTRELPFKADTAIAMAQKHVADPPTPLHTFRGGSALTATPTGTPSMTARSTPET
jgi:serine/threonine protein kinase